MKPSENMTKAELLAYINEQEREKAAIEKKAKDLEEKAEALEKADISEAVSRSPADTQKWLNERVPFIAFKDNDKYKDDINVGINGKTFIIKRGVQVMIPRYVKMALDDSAAQDAYAADVINGLQEQYQQRSKELGL